MDNKVDYKALTVDKITKFVGECFYGKQMRDNTVVWMEVSASYLCVLSDEDLIALCNSKNKIRAIGNEESLELLRQKVLRCGLTIT